MLTSLQMAVTSISPLSTKILLLQHTMHSTCMQENVEGSSSFPQTFLLSQNDIPCYYQGLSLEVYMKVI